MSDISIALNRFGLGARPDEPLPSDARRWLVDQFEHFEPAPPPIAPLPDRARVITVYNDYRKTRRAARRRTAAADKGARNGETGASGSARLKRRDVRDLYVNAVGARMNAALTTSAPFIERLVHFWANHFAISTDSLIVTALAGPFEFEAIRPHVLGRFGDMLNAVERHPAMLFYLDQARSVGPDSKRGKRVIANGGRRPRVNENLGREAMELHTLGVRTGYSQQDVVQFASALTGWTVSGVDVRANPRAIRPGTPGEFMFAPRLHEPGARTIMGKSYPQRGEAQAQAVLDDLAIHPATARHVATKLARHFAGDVPPPALVARLETAFLKSGGDLPTVYRALIDAPEAWTPAPVKFKSPWEWSVSAMRALGTRAARPSVVTPLMKKLGQPVWKPGSPAGYDDIAGAWAAPDAVLRRVEAGARMAARAEAPDARAMAPKLFPAALGDGTRRALARAESPNQALALLLVAPEMMRR